MGSSPTGVLPLVAPRFDHRGRGIVSRFVREVVILTYVLALDPHRG